MQRGAFTLASVTAVVVALWLAARGFHPPRTSGQEARDHDAEAETDDGGGLLFALDAATGSKLADDAGAATLLPTGDPRFDRGPGAFLLDGTQPPPLPLTVPRSVHFGVVLVSYAGAQPNPNGGHPATRSRADALALATKLSATAKDDFHAAVQQGDAGSSDDLGVIKLGLLEPAPEYVLFTLPVGGVGGPVDTPRGYWVLKRLE
jgi:hypothetical protein